MRGWLSELTPPKFLKPFYTWTMHMPGTEAPTAIPKTLNPKP